jgi:hypothetical protein
MRQIVQLEKEMSQISGTRPSRWGIKQRLMLLGGLLIAGAIALGILIWVAWPAPPVRKVGADDIYRATMSLTPLQSLAAWEMLIRTPLGKLDTKTVSPAMTAAYKRKVAQRQSLGIVAAIMGVVGLGFLVGATMMPNTRAAA